MSKEPGAILDLWFHKKWRPNVPDGEAIIVRYADDIVVGFQHKRDAERYLERMTEILWPRASIRHPWPDQRFAVKAPEVGAGWFNDHVRICAGGAQQCAFLP